VKIVESPYLIFFFFIDLFFGGFLPFRGLKRPPQPPSERAGPGLIFDKYDAHIDII
jgi:hypothetical protein